MSLKVWLPLTGDLKNYGCTNMEFINSNATINTSGKIGSCYSFNGSNAQIYAVHDKSIWNEKPISICMWYKFVAGNTTNCVVDIAADLCLSYTQNSSGLRFSYWRAYSNSSGTRTGDSNTISQYYDVNSWHHVVYVADHNLNKIYVDGALASSFDSSSKYTTNFKPLLRSNYNRITVGKSAGSSPFASGLVNDVRIYDHALSLSEIKEISQGLILHYKLDSKYIEETTNLYNGTFSNTCFNGATNKYGYGTSTDMYKTTGLFQGKDSVKIYMGTAGLDAYPYIYFDAFNTAGTNIHTLSFDYYPTTQTSIIPYSYNGAYNISYITNNGDSNALTNTSQITIPVITNQWNHISITMQKYDTTNTTRGNGYIRIGNKKHTSTTTDYWLFANIQIEAKAYETGYTKPGTTRNNTIIQDSSGYGHNGEIISELRISNNSARYKNSTLFDGVDNCIITPYNTICPENIFTINLWFKKDALGSKKYETLFGGPSGFEMDTRAGSATSLSLYMASTRSGNRATGITMNEWHMITMTRDGTTEKYYVDGEFKSEIEAKPMPNGVYRIGAWASNTGQNYYGLISDFRIYATPLLDNDIKKLYNTSMSIDKAYRAHTFELEEKTANLLFPAENSRIQLEFGHGLSRYTQANCQVTLTQDGYHIYRPPNYTPANNGNTMWGGLKLVNQSTDTISPYNSTRDNIWGLTTGHTYLITFMVTGQSSNGTNISMNHNMGNGVSNGIGPSPTVLKEKTLPANFEGTQQCYRIFTINDDVVKTCNKTGAGYTIDQQYLSYRHIVFGFGYSNTGALGTDLYLTHFQLYDITDKVGQVLKNGIVDFSSFNEEDIENAKIQRSNIFFADGFIER